MIRSLVGRLTLLEQLTALVVVVAFGVTSLLLTAHALRNERREFVRLTAGRLAAGMDDELKEEPDTLVAAQGVVEDGVTTGVLVEVRDREGRVLAASPGAGRASRARGRSGPGARTAEVFEAHAASASGFVISARVSDAVLKLSLSALARSLLIAAIPILVLGVLLSRALVARALRPLSVMADRASVLTAEPSPRSLGARSGLEELDRFAIAFDRLLERLDDALTAERRLSADVSHELRTPLTVLSGEVEMLLERTPADSPAAAGLRRASDQLGAMRELVEAILLLQRSSGSAGATRDRAELVNLADLAREALAQTIARYPGRESDVRLAAPDEVLVKGHTSLLASALRNLLDNALKFTRPGERVEVDVAAAGGHVTLAVDDQGPGIPAEERDRVFDPFFRGAEARAAVSGFGLGLPILRRVARAHGGEVKAGDSALGGARLVLSLPRYESGPAPPLTTPASS